MEASRPSSISQDTHGKQARYDRDTLAGKQRGHRVVRPNRLGAVYPLKCFFPENSCILKLLPVDLEILPGLLYSSTATTPHQSRRTCEKNNVWSRHAGKKVTRTRRGTPQTPQGGAAVSIPFLLKLRLFSNWLPVCISSILLFSGFALQ